MCVSECVCEGSRRDVCICICGFGWTGKADVGGKYVSGSPARLGTSDSSWAIATTTGVGGSGGMAAKLEDCWPGRSRGRGGGGGVVKPRGWDRRLDGSNGDGVAWRGVEWNRGCVDGGWPEQRLRFSSCTERNI